MTTPLNVRIAWCVGLGSLALAAPAFSAPDEVEDVEVDDEETRVLGGTKRRIERVRVPAAEAPSSAEPQYHEVATGLSLRELADRPFPPSTYVGAHALDLEPEFVHGVQEGLDLLFLRRYNDARDHFTKMEETWPGCSLAAVADTLVWQALMLENFDFKFEKQYQVSTKEARKGLEAALKQPGNDAWEHILLGGIVGIEAIHSVRKSSYMPALQLAFTAMDHISKARALAPNFVDLTLADGMYNYWRSVVTMSSDLLPDFEDRREEGIKQMQVVEQTGVFLQPLASLALAFTWAEEGDNKRTLNACTRNRSRYPDNIINNLVTATTYITMKRYDKALEVLDDVLRVDPNNKRVRYWRGVAQLKSGNLGEAEKELKLYLASDYLEDYQRGNAHYRMGQVYARQKEHAEAYAAFKAADKVSGHKGAKRALDRMKERKKAGKISY